MPRELIQTTTKIAIETRKVHKVKELIDGVSKLRYYITVNKQDYTLSYKGTVGLSVRHDYNHGDYVKINDTKYYLRY